MTHPKKGSDYFFCLPCCSPPSSESLPEATFTTTCNNDFGPPDSNPQPAAPREGEPLRAPFTVKKDRAVHPCKERVVTASRPVRDPRKTPLSPVQRKKVPSRQTPMKKVPTPPVKEATSPHPAGKVAPTCADRKVALPNPGRKAVPPKPPAKKEGVTPTQPVRKVAPPCHPQKAALPNLTREETPPRPAQDKVPSPCPVDKVTPRLPRRDKKQEMAAQVQLNLELRAAKILLSLDKKKAEIQNNLEKLAAQIQMNLERKKAQIRRNLEHISAQIRHDLDEKVSQIKRDLVREEALIQLNLEEMLDQIHHSMEEKAAQIELELERKEDQIQSGLEETEAFAQSELVRTAAWLQQLGTVGTEIPVQPRPPDIIVLDEEGAAQNSQDDLLLTGTLPQTEPKRKVEKDSPGLSPDSFLFHKVLGEGAFGKVMLAQLRESGEYFALKALKKDYILANSLLEYVKVEKRVLILAAGNPFLIHLHSTFQTEDTLFFVMEYVNGRDLHFHIEYLGHFDFQSTQFYVAEIVCGLQFLHRNGVIYRDLKLSNIMLTEDGHIKIVDFGLCKDNMIDGEAMSFCGTEYYMAPEIFQREEYSFPVDWWSLGVVVFIMLTGDYPFEGNDSTELAGSVCNDPVDYPDSLNQESKDLLEELLEREPTLRLGVAEDIRAHPFFDIIDWPALEEREMAPPLKPTTTVGDPEDGQSYQEFLDNLSSVSQRDTGSVNPDDQLAFVDFSFINPEWKS